MTYKAGGVLTCFHQPLLVCVMSFEVQYAAVQLLTFAARTWFAYSNTCSAHLGQYITVSRQLSRSFTVSRQSCLPLGFPARCMPIVAPHRTLALHVGVANAVHAPLRPSTHGAAVAVLRHSTIACVCMHACMQVVGACTIRLQVVHVVCKLQFAARTPSRSHGAVAWQ